MNAENNAVLADILEQGLTIEGGESETAPLSVRKEKTHNEAAALVPLLRVALGNTTLRELWIRATRKTPYREVVDIRKWANGILSEKTIAYLHKRAQDLNLFTATVTNKATGEKEKISSLKPLEFYTNPEFARTSWDEKNPTDINVWVFVRAVSRAISFSNYRNYMKHKTDGSTPFRYDVDSNHRIVQQMVTGVMTWEHPTKLTFSWAPAETEEDFLRPFVYVRVPHPDDPESTISVKVYKKTGNAYKQMDLVEDEPSTTGSQLIERFMQLSKGESASIKYDSEMRESEVEKQMESDLAFLQRRAEDDGIQIYISPDPANRTVTVYHAGWAGNPVAIA